MKNNLESYVYATKEKLASFSRLRALVLFWSLMRCTIGFTWTEKMVTNLGEVPIRSKKKFVIDKLYGALYSKILLPYHEFFQGT